MKVQKSLLIWGYCLLIPFLALYCVNWNQYKKNIATKKYAQILEIISKTRILSFSRFDSNEIEIFLSRIKVFTRVAETLIIPPRCERNVEYSLYIEEIIIGTVRPITLIKATKKDAMKSVFLMSDFTMLYLMISLLISFLLGNNFFTLNMKNL